MEDQEEDEYSEGESDYSDSEDEGQDGYKKGNAPLLYHAPMAPPPPGQCPLATKLPPMR